jgi:uncharacterized membrane protein YhiD involved in acid resistance
MDQILDQFNQATTAAIALVPFLVNLALTGALCGLLSVVFVRFGRSVGDRWQMARIFPVIGMTTMIVITIVKSSLALSLGLVGALSIVRFRTAIKEPEELAYLFISIGVGLGLGAEQRAITLAGFLIVALGVFAMSRKVSAHQSGFFLVIDTASKKLTETLATAILQRHADTLVLKRLEESPQRREISYSLTFKSSQGMETSLAELKKADPRAGLSLLDRQHDLA